MATGIRPAVLVLAPFLGSDSLGDRPRFVTEVLARFADVDVVTTDFDHLRKERRATPKLAAARSVVSVPTRPYKSNFGPARLISHAAAAWRMARYARQHRRAYDAIYSTAPFNFAAWAAFRATPEARRILDVVDVWPDVLPFPGWVRRLGAPFFYLWRWFFKAACARADVLMSVSDTFLEMARSHFVGSAAAVARFYIAHPPLPRPAVTPEERLTIAYVGNIGRLYDFETLVAALGRAYWRDRVQVLLVGEGDRREWLLARLTEVGVSCTYFGVVYDAGQLAGILRRAHIGFNGYRFRGAAFSYKATTYLAAGLPLLNSMPGDLERLVAERGIGVNYRAGDVDALEAALQRWQASAQSVWREAAEAFFRTEIELSGVAQRMERFLATQLVHAGHAPD